MQANRMGIGYVDVLRGDLRGIEQDIGKAEQRLVALSRLGTSLTPSLQIHKERLQTQLADLMAKKTAVRAQIAKEESQGGLPPSKGA